MNVLGCNAFGLKDCVTLPGEGYVEEKIFRLGFDSLMDAVLPKTPFGLISTGIRAELDRVHTGLEWPPESVINYSDSLRRVPISCAWKILVESGDTPVRWDTGEGASFLIGKIIAKHLETIIQQASERAGPDKDFKKQSIVIAIPDHLDEFGKETVLRALPKEMSDKVQFLWRPIAAGLAWLDKFQNELPDPNSEDWILVAYMGPDGMEFTPLRLRLREHNGKRFIIPLRARPSTPPGPTGIDWQAMAIEELFNISEDEPGAFWQAFTDFPEIWLALAQSNLNQEKLPRPWSKKNSWDCWHPGSELNENIWSVHVKESKFLKCILKKHYANTQNLRRGQGLTWSSHLSEELSETLRSGPNGKLLGLIICGPLAPLEIPPWVADSKDILKQHGLIIEEPYKQSSGLWLDNSNKLIALGAKIFGHRDLLGEPTYLDTLPGLSIFARKNNNEIDWIDLIEPGEQDGGVLYEKSIKGKFQLNNNEIKLNVFLKKEDKDWRGSLSPLRKGEINFKSVGHEKTIIDIKIEMRPTKGIAKIELIPRNMRLGNRGLEYSIMNPIKKEDLPKLRQAWPETIKVGISKDPLDFAVTQPYDDFFEEEYNSNRYIRKLDVVKSCLTAGVGKSANGRIKWLKKIDQDGKAGSPEGQKIIEQISSKLESDFRKIVSIRGSQNYGDIQKILIRGAWLWGACPKSLVKHLEEYFRSHDRVHFGQPWTYFLEAASRCFLNPASYKILFSAIRSRIKNNQTSTTFPIQSSRSIVKILQYRDRGHEGLDRETAELFVTEAIKSIEGEVNRHEFSMLQSHQKFWQGILLFFLLMRFRIIQDDFLDPDNSNDREKFNRVFNCLGKAYGLTQNAKFKKIENDIKEYQHKRGAPGIIKTLVDLVESDVDNNEEPTVHEMQADPNLIIPVEETTNLEPEVNSGGISSSDDVERKESLEKDLIETREALEDEIDSTQIQVLKYHIEYLEGEIESL